MFSPASKTTKTAPAVQQKAAGTTFFKKAGEETFFGSTKHSSFFGSRLQAKLTVSTPDDPQEKEADAVSDKVMTMPEPLAASLPEGDEEKLQKKEEELQEKAETPVVALRAKAGPQRKVQAKCSCEQCSKHEHVDARLETGSAAGCHHPASAVSLYPSDIRRQSGRGPPAGSPQFEQTLQSSKGSGSALPGDTKQFMESRFSADFSNVRVHTDQRAETLSRSVHAQAFAHGNDIYFDSGKYSPGSTAGRTLLAHELTHTIQQGASKSKVAPAIFNQASRKTAFGKSGSKPDAQSAIQVQLQSGQAAPDERLQPKSCPCHINKVAQHDIVQRQCYKCGKKGPVDPNSEPLVAAGAYSSQGSILITRRMSETDEKNPLKKVADSANDSKTVSKPQNDKKNPNQLATDNKATDSKEKAAGLPGESAPTTVSSGPPAVVQPVQDVAKPNKVAKDSKVGAPGSKSLPTNGTALTKGGKAANNPGSPQKGKVTSSSASKQQATARLDRSSPSALLRSLGTASYSNFGQLVTAARAAVPSVHNAQKEDMVQALPRIQKPTGLPAKTTRVAAPRTTTTQRSPTNLQVAGEAGERQQTEQMPAAESFSANRSAVSVAEPAATAEDSGSWWSWLSDRISSFLSNLPGTDSGVSTEAGERPQVNLSGPADPQQNEALAQVADTDVNNGITEGNNQTLNDFGEHHINPVATAETLTPSTKISAAPTRGGTVQQPAVPEMIRAAVDQAVQPMITNAVNEKAEAYQQQQDQYQQQSLQAKQEGLNNIELENAQTQIFQQQMQLTAQQEVNAERERWRQENKRVQENYESKSEAKRLEVNAQIETKAQTAGQEAGTKLTEAENNCKQEKEKAEAQARSKKQEAENKPQSWWESFKGAVSSAFNAIRDSINAVFDTLRQVVRTIINAARTVANAIIDAARNAIIGFIRAFGDVLKAFVAIALAQFPEIAQRARAFIDACVERAADAVSSAAERLKEFASQALNYIGDTLDRLLSDLQARFNSFIDWVADVARGVVNIIENGIKIDIPDITLFSPKRIPLTNFPTFQKQICFLGGGTLLGPVAIGGALCVRLSAKPSVVTTIGPGYIRKASITLNPFAGNYSATGEVYVGAATTEVVVLEGALRGNGLVGTIEPPLALIAAIEGGLRATLRGSGLGAIQETVTLGYNSRAGISLDVINTLKLGVLLEADFDLFANASVYNLTVCEYVWPVGHLQTGKAEEYSLPVSLRYGGGGPPVTIGPVANRPIPVTDIEVAIDRTRPKTRCLSLKEIIADLCKRGILPPTVCPAPTGSAPLPGGPAPAPGVTPPPGPVPTPIPGGTPLPGGGTPGGSPPGVLADTCANSLTKEFKMNVDGRPRVVNYKDSKHMRMAKKTLPDMQRAARVANCDTDLDQDCEKAFCNAAKLKKKEYGSQIDKNTRRENRIEALLKQAWENETPPTSGAFEVAAEDDTDVGFDLDITGATKKYIVKTNVEVGGKVFSRTHLFPKD